MYNVMNEETGEMQNSQKLLKQDITWEIWSLAICKELSTLSYGYKGLVEVTHTLLFMSHDDICDIPRDKTVIYACIVVDYWPQKADPNRIRLTLGVIYSMSQGISTLKNKTLQHLRYCGIVCCQQNMPVFHASISRICISKIQ